MARKSRARQRPRLLIIVLLVGLFALSGIYGLRYADNHPQNLPWTELDINGPIGWFTGQKLVALHFDFPACRTVLEAANTEFSALEPAGEDACLRDRNLRRLGGSDDQISYRPSEPSASCAVQAALVIWEREVVQPAAREYLGQPVRAITHIGTFNCRRIGSDRDAPWSEHATANAIDIAGFTLRDGQKISLLDDWTGDGPKATFLRTVRDQSCGLFSTVLSPDYDAAHADHFHFDQAVRGRYGWRLCR